LEQASLVSNDTGGCGLRWAESGQNVSVRSLADLLIDFDAALDWPVDGPRLVDDQPQNGVRRDMDHHGVDHPSQDD
jgi:hypothetical protein